MATEKESSIIISLPHMVDLALGSPEVGAVNFNVLHSLLHVMLQQMDLRKTQVEFRGPDCDRIKAILQTAPSSPTLKLSQYTIAPEESKANLAKKASRDRKYDEEARPTSAKKTKEGESKKKKEKEGSVVLVQQSEEVETSEVVEREVDKDTPARRISKEDLSKVEDKVNELEKKVSQLQSLPSNEELITRSRSSSQTKPVSDMWTLMNLTKRVDAAEECINKLTSMVEDLAKDTAAGAPEQEGKPARTSDLRGRVEALEARVAAMEGQPVHTGPAGTSGESKAAASAPSKPATTDSIVVGIRKELAQVKKDVDNIGSQIQQITAITEKIPFNTFMDGIKEIDDLRARFEEFAGIMKQKAASSTADQEIEQQGRINELEEKLNMCAGQMEGIDCSLTQQMDTLHNQIADLEKELGEILEKVNTGTPMGESFSQDFAGLSDLYNKIQFIQGDMENLNQTATRLMDDREERQLHIEALLEQIEVLKNIKADREDLEEALADKADQNTVNRKVSHDQFDAACDDLSRGLEEALAKLTQQETIWQQALDDIQREIENKLDKIEISPLKDFVNSKLKTLQERLKAIANMRKESEAAGTKLKLLRNVNCISCDKEVVMRTRLEVPNIPAPEPMPPSRSMRAYLTYELDQIRKQQRRPPGKNLVALEEAQREKVRDKETPYKETRSVDHLCNRYCGGSHTITTPQQRVARIGHFLTQWGPQAIGLSEGTVRGTDGNMYRAREMPPQTPKSTKPASDLQSPAQKQTSVVEKKPSLTERKGSLTSPKKMSSSSLQKKSSSRVIIISPQPPGSPVEKRSSAEISSKAVASTEKVPPGSPQKKRSVERSSLVSPKRSKSSQEEVVDETASERTDAVPGSPKRKASAEDTEEEAATRSPEQEELPEGEEPPTESSEGQEPQEEAPPSESPERSGSKEMSSRSFEPRMSKDAAAYEHRSSQETPSVEPSSGEDAPSNADEAPSEPTGTEEPTEAEEPVVSEEPSSEEP